MQQSAHFKAKSS